MNIKAIFPEGVTALTVTGLHQWDYGRKLEIQAADLPGTVEVHFACPGMTEAEVRVCANMGGVVEAVIPDQCLEQTSPISVWVFVIDGSEGLTVKSVTMYVTARARPQLSPTVPTEFYDKYTEVITEMNRLLASLNTGEYKVQNAFSADYATAAGTAGRATEAIFASADKNKGTIDARLERIDVDASAKYGTFNIAPVVNAEQKLTEAGYYYIAYCERSGSESPDMTLLSYPEDHVGIVYWEPGWYVLREALSTLNTYHNVHLNIDTQGKLTLTEEIPGSNMGSAIPAEKVKFFTHKFIQKVGG